MLLSNTPVAQSLSTDLQSLRSEFGFPGDNALTLRCTVAWSMIVGAVSLEVFGQYGADTFADPGAVFDEQVRIGLDVLVGAGRASSN